jgi:integrase
VLPDVIFPGSARRCSIEDNESGSGGIVATFDPQKRPRWSPQDLGEFVDQVRDDRLFALWMLVATTGIRLDTLLDLRRGDVDMQEARLSLAPQRVQRDDDVPLSVVKRFALDPDAHEALREHAITWDREHVDRSRLRSELLFTSNEGTRLDPEAVNSLFHQHCRRAGLSVVPLQAMRQAYVVAAIETGIPTAVLGERLGRKVTPTTLGAVPRVDPPNQQITAGRRGRNTPARNLDRRGPWRSPSF